MNNQFTVHLVSNASMDIFRENTMASFRNQLSGPLELTGSWQVALESIIFPTSIKNVTSVKIKEYPDDGYITDSISKVDEKKKQNGKYQPVYTKMSLTYSMQSFKIQPCKDLSI